MQTYRKFITQPEKKPNDINQMPLHTYMVKRPAHAAPARYAPPNSYIRSMYILMYVDGFMWV